MKEINIGFIGAGNMTKSLVTGLVREGFDPARLFISNPRQEKLQHFKAQYPQCHIFENNTALIARVDLLVLSVKPQVLDSVLEEIAPQVDQHKPLILSIAAGITTRRIQAAFQQPQAIVRCMPNIAAMVGASASALFANSQTTSAQKTMAENMTRSVGVCCTVEKESDLDIVTALSGSGPAYFFSLMNAMIEAAVNQGLAADTARLLALQTAVGAASVAMQSECQLTSLIQHVTSKKGTTQAALASLEEHDFQQTIAAAMDAAVTRAKALSK